MESLHNNFNRINVARTNSIFNFFYLRIIFYNIKLVFKQVRLPIKHPVEVRHLFSIIGAIWLILQEENLLLFGRFPDVACAYMM